MRTDRMIPVVAGVLFIIATVADLVSRVGFLQPILSDPVDFATISADHDQVLVGAILLFIGAAAAGGIAISLYPVLRKHNEGLALGSVCFRLIESTLYIGVVVCLLLLVTVSQDAASAGPAASAAYDVPGSLLMAARDTLGEVAVLAFGLGGLMYYWVFYRARLVPRWLSAWGLLAAASVMASSLLVVLGLVEPMSTTQIVLALPILVQEMVLAAWLIGKGFDPSAMAPESDSGTSGRLTAARSAA